MAGVLLLIVLPIVVAPLAVALWAAWWIVAEISAAGGARYYDVHSSRRPLSMNGRRPDEAAAVQVVRGRVRLDP